MFFGFYIYCLRQLVKKEEFEQIINMVSSETSHKIIAFELPKPFDKKHVHNTLDVTYKQFYNKFFVKLTLHDLQLIGEYIFSSGELNNWYPDNQDFEERVIFTTKDRIEAIKSVYSNGYSRNTMEEKISSILRKGFNSELCKSSDEVSDVYIKNKPINRIEFLEAAHIVPVSEIKKLCKILIEDQQEEKLEQILNLCCSPQNGVLIPMNFHNFYDNGYICIHENQNKFILTEKGENLLESLELLGFSADNSIKKLKYNEIIETIKHYRVLTKNIKL